jgi:hypothetical protein
METFRALGRHPSVEKYLSKKAADFFPYRNIPDGYQDGYGQKVFKQD